MNRFQRWYFARAEPHYACMTPELRDQASRIDRYLYSRRGVGFWLGALAAVLATALGLWKAGFAPADAALLALLMWLSLGISLIAAWLRPEKFAPRRLLRGSLFALLWGYAGAAVGFLAIRVVEKGWPDGPGWLDALAILHRKALPIVACVVLLMMAMMTGVAAVRMWQRERELAGLKLRQERDHAARQAAEARLRLLQAQIEPHFIFNTLAAAQHWVDTGDPRAGALLRSLTGFLRTSTELLGRETTTLAEELPVVRDYLQVMQARLGARLQFELAVDAEVHDQALPPGLLLTLVENAVEHGVSPSLEGGRVALTARRDPSGSFELSVVNTGSPLADGWRDGVGLANSRERLANRFGCHARLGLSRADGHTRATLRIDATTQSLGVPA